MTEDTSFLGINRESDYGDRPRYVVQCIPTGERVCTTYNDGYVDKEAEEPYFHMIDALGADGVTMPFSEFAKAAKAQGYTLTVEDTGERNEFAGMLPDTNSALKMREKSAALGKNQFEPLVGGAIICKDCPYCVKKVCSYTGEVIIERFNDLIEYCWTKSNSVPIKTK